MTDNRENAASDIDPPLSWKAEGREIHYDYFNFGFEDEGIDDLVARLGKAGVPYRDIVFAVRAALADMLTAQEAADAAGREPKDDA